MSSNKSASLEARLKNSKDLVTMVKGYSRYSPTSEDIKKEGYESFVDSVDVQITPFKNASGEMKTTINSNNEIFDKLVKVSKDVRYEILEIKNKDSVEYSQVNSIVRVITGENISDHSDMKKKVLGGLKEGDPQPEFSSVSELDHKSQLGNFRSLLGLLRSYTFYSPSDVSLSITSLEALEAEATASLADIASKESTYINERSNVIHLFEGEIGLLNRAKRAKVHVKRKYGVKSPEYRALVNKKY